MIRARTSSPARNGLPAVLPLLLAAALLLAIGPGCLGGKTAGNGDRYLGGAYNSNNEPPAFGDAEIAAMTADPVYDDPFNQAKSAPSQDAVIRMRVVWGNLIIDPDATEWHDYSGQMTIDDGTLVIERTIAFEGTDSQIDTRDDPTKIAWTSHTQPAFDGLAVRVEPGSTPAAENTLHLAIGAYTKDITVADLADLTFSEPTGLGFDHVGLASQEGTDADTGFLYGHFRDVARTGGGVFKGKWEAASGTLGGHELARYVYSGRRIRGKAIDTEGNFVALLNGTFQRTNPNEREGTFAVDWLSADGGTTLDTSHGVYLHAPGSPRGFAMGVWKKN